jgi:hypothetical protein
MEAVDVFNAIMNIVTVAGVVGLAVWAHRRTGSDREAREQRRAVVREIGRMRMRERDSMEMSRMMAEVRRRVDGIEASTVTNYLAGVKERAGSNDRPQLRAVD